MTPTDEQLAAWEAETRLCPSCRSGWLAVETCSVCDGSGRVSAHPAMPALICALREAWATVAAQSDEIEFLREENQRLRDLQNEKLLK